jgi:hypothetical protein
MKKFNLYLEVESLRRLRVISDVSLGKPDVSSLIRQAIDTFIHEQGRVNPTIQRALDRDTAPRLIRSGTRQQRTTDSDDSNG